MEPSLGDLSLSQEFLNSQGSFSDFWQNINVQDLLSTPSMTGPLDDNDPSSSNQLPELQVQFDDEIFNISAEPLATEGVPPPTPTVLVTTDHPGEYDFLLRFQKSGTAKSVTSTFSVMLNKLYCQLAKTTPVEILVSKEPPAGAILKAMAVYKKTEHAADVVRRCPHHQNQDAAEHRSHLIRMEGSQRVQYFEDVFTKRQSVTVPYETPQLGSEMTTILLSFMCNSSCMGGMNRRPILAILTLETPEGVILGRRCFEVRICACPGRDRKSEEENHTQIINGTKQTKKRKSTPATTSAPVKRSVPTSTTSSTEGDDEEIFYLPIRGRDRYELFKRFYEGLEQDKKGKNKSNAAVDQQHVPMPISGKRLMLKGERSDTE
ncbi:cellular tumor antigen p53-like isoform X2 [Hippocampus comes]|uniref:Cellular tumor antigen p53 n=2 Tax=Hippocampus comes TaxID=109280 RepID=A0A3Q2YVH3_HIPCM|nr:PREDICTED: cellular tumor antigen p53-like isoform X2 [Hippocampus comes]XP_019746645.1 PREDICTED: cellular tumor antigen p53-like isoform X2 [Hippocampus comes]XP_019746646.1 PREDICTED: cellular tumor antigen p53-like isoform X2 [Hippocampus comes]XP_019746649.1 PREDICTED: cellular tumor antigen p53-like isoform X2 [Hippocampus comes]